MAEEAAITDAAALQPQMTRHQRYYALHRDEKLAKVKPTINTKLICAQIRTGGGYDHPFMEYKNLFLYI